MNYIGSGWRLLRGLCLVALIGLPVAWAQAPATEPVRGSFLVAARTLTDPNFAESVVLLIEHSSVGTLGVIVNRPTQFELGEAVQALTDLDRIGHRLYQGGPVSREALNYIARRAPPGDSLQLLDGVHLGGTRSGLKALLQEDIPRSDLRVYGGYAGWAPGQLAVEIAHGSWHVLPATVEAVFSVQPEGLWKVLIQRADPPGIMAWSHP